TSGLAKLDLPGKAALAGQLFVEAMAVEDNSARRYALLEASRDVALSGGDLAGAKEAADALAVAYEIDPLTVASETVLTAAKTVRSDDMARALASSAVRYSDLMFDAGNFETATKLNSLVTTLSKRVGGSPFTQFAVARGQRQKALKTDFDRLS